MLLLGHHWLDLACPNGHHFTKMNFRSTTIVQYLMSWCIFDIFRAFEGCHVFETLKYVVEFFTILRIRFWSISIFGRKIQANPSCLTALYLNSAIYNSGTISQFIWFFWAYILQKKDFLYAFCSDSDHAKLNYPAKNY